MGNQGGFVCLWGDVVVIRNDLKIAIIRAGKTNVQVARECGIDPNYISGIITGRKMPSLILALKIAKAVNKPLDEIFWLEPGE